MLKSRIIEGDEKRDNFNCPVICNSSKSGSNPEGPCANRGGATTEYLH